jgi:hypothetical protein
MTLNCQRCGKPTLVPMMSMPASPTPPQELTDLQRKLKENESQRTEVTGYINNSAFNCIAGSCACKR